MPTGTQSHFVFHVGGRALSSSLSEPGLWGRGGQEDVVEGKNEEAPGLGPTFHFAVWPWASHVSSLSLCFLISKTKVLNLKFQGCAPRLIH